MYQLSKMSMQSTLLSKFSTVLDEAVKNLFQRIQERYSVPVNELNEIWNNTEKFVAKNDTKKSQI